MYQVGGFITSGLAQNVTPLRAIEFVLVLLAGHVVLQTVYNVWFHPLRKFPGPFFARAGRLWYSYQLLTGRVHSAVEDAHQRYGSKIRIAPNELSFVDLSAWDEIYNFRHGKLELGKVVSNYEGIMEGSVLISPKERHGTVRKALSHGFSDKSLRAQESLIRSYADRLISKLQQHLGLEAFNIVEYYNAFTFDVISDLAFGESFDAMNSNNSHLWLDVFSANVYFSTIMKVTLFWPTVAKLLRSCVPPRLKKIGREVHELAVAKAKSRHSYGADRSDLMAGMLLPTSNTTYTEFEGTTHTIIGAGSETTATTLSALTFFLLKNPDCLEKLQIEIASKVKSPEDITISTVNQMPYLLACINETLRVNPPISDGFTRTTIQHEVVCGENLPPKTLLRVPHYAMFRSGDHFKRSKEFIPERWLANNPEFANDHRSVVQPFQVGPRNCLGRNLAFFELRLVLCLLFFNLDLKLQPESEDWTGKNFGCVLWLKSPLKVKVLPKTPVDPAKLAAGGIEASVMVPWAGATQQTKD